jgi:lipopolysaccharide/colanic/teichoic acid biosynthesis glycosyltransferase
LTSLWSRLLALLLLIPAAPILLLTAIGLKLFRPGPVLFRKEVVQLPALPEEEISWRDYALWSFINERDRETGRKRPITSTFGDLLFRFLPALINIVRGDLGFVGVPPRSREEIQLLSHDWRALYLHSKAGIVTEACIRYHNQPTEDELYIAEGFYAVAASWFHDLNLLLRFLGRACFGFLWARRVIQTDDSVPSATPG